MDFLLTSKWPKQGHNEEFNIEVTPFDINAMISVSIMGPWQKLEASKGILLQQSQNSRWHQHINNTKIIGMLEQ